MSTGPEHYRQAEFCLRRAEALENADLVANHLRAAQVHATLALAPPGAVVLEDLDGDDLDWLIEAARHWPGGMGHVIEALRDARMRITNNEEKN